MRRYNISVILPMREKSMRNWSVSFWVDDRGQSPVVRYLDQLAARERAKLARYLELLAEFGPKLSMPHARHITGKL